MGLPADTKGVLVLAVGRGSAAERGGLRPAEGSTLVNGAEVPVGGDVITAIDGAPIAGMDEAAGVCGGAHAAGGHGGVCRAAGRGGADGEHHDGGAAQVARGCGIQGGIRAVLRGGGRGGGGIV